MPLRAHYKRILPAHAASSPGFRVAGSRPAPLGFRRFFSGFRVPGSAFSPLRLCAAWKGRSLWSAASAPAKPWRSRGAVAALDCGPRTRQYGRANASTSLIAGQARMGLSIQPPGKQKRRRRPDYAGADAALQGLRVNRALPGKRISTRVPGSAFGRCPQSRSVRSHAVRRYSSSFFTGTAATKKKRKDMPSRAHYKRQRRLGIAAPANHSTRSVRFSSPGSVFQVPGSAVCSQVPPFPL